MIVKSFLFVKNYFSNFSFKEFHNFFFFSLIYFQYHSSVYCSTIIFFCLKFNIASIKSLKYKINKKYLKIILFVSFQYTNSKTNILLVWFVFKVLDHLLSTFNQIMINVSVGWMNVTLVSDTARNNYHHPLTEYLVSVFPLVFYRPIERRIIVEWPVNSIYWEMNFIFFSVTFENKNLQLVIPFWVTEDVTIIYRIELVDSDIGNDNILRERTVIFLVVIRCGQHQIDHRHLVE